MEGRRLGLHYFPLIVGGGLRGMVAERKRRKHTNLLPLHHLQGFTDNFSGPIFPSFLPSLTRSG